MILHEAFRYKAGGRQFRGWCKGESGLLETESVPWAPMVMQQLLASIRRAGCQVRAPRYF